MLLAVKNCKQDKEGGERWTRRKGIWPKAKQRMWWEDSSKEKAKPKFWAGLVVSSYLCLLLVAIFVVTDTLLWYSLIAVIGFVISTYVVYRVTIWRKSYVQFCYRCLNYTIWVYNKDLNKYLCSACVALDKAVQRRV